MLTDALSPFVRVGPVQIEDDVATLERTILDDFLDEIAIRLASVFLFGSFSKPTVLRKGQPNMVDPPIANCRLHGLENMALAVAGPFHRGGVHAPQSDGPAVDVLDLDANHFESFGRLRGNRLSRDPRGSAFV